jgi:excisionase family DNA binding protein
MEKSPNKDTLLLTVSEVARLCGCSPRTIHRLSDGGKMPRPVKIGALVRWEREALYNWIAGGCKSLRSPLTKASQQQLHFNFTKE